MPSSVRYGALFLLLALQLTDAAVLVRFINTVPSRVGATSLKEQWRPVNLQKTSVDTAFKWYCPFGGSVDATTTSAAALQNACKSTGATEYYPGYPSRYNHVALQQRRELDSVGLYYFAGSSANRLSAAHVVWTESPAALYETSVWTGATQTPGTNNNIVAYHALRNAMPPLRKAHKAAAGTTPVEETVTDRVVNQDVPSAADLLVAQYRPAVADYYTHDTLKADGVGLYMSFAAGTYEFQAYGVKAPGSTGKDLDSESPNMPEPFQQSSTSLTFEDNKVYTIVATGSGSWTNIISNSVDLFLIEESTKPTQFGMAEIRFYHAINPLISSTVDIYTGSTTVDDASLLYSGLQFGIETSPYFAISPERSVSFPLTIEGNSDELVTVAPINSDTKAVSFDVIAGLRATAICATTSEDRPQEIFCRMIPSRVVAYVRLIADTAGFEGPVHGKFGPSKVSETELQLWASYEVPKPAVLVPGSRDMSSANNNGGSPASSVGLYPVAHAAPGTVSGYGEVHVPIFIMDFAVTTRIAPSCTDGFGEAGILDDWKNFFPRANTRGALCYNRATAQTVAANVPIVNSQFRLQTEDRAGFVSPIQKLWRDHAPIFKRVNMVVKSDGMATVSNTCNLRSNYQNGAIGAGLQTLVDIYMEPGQYYSVSVIPQTYLGCGNDATRNKAKLDIEVGQNFRFGISRDISVSESTQKLRDGWARISFIPLGDPMNWVGATVANGAEAAYTGANAAVQNLQQNFQGTVVFTDTNSASEEEIAITFDQYSYREVIPSLTSPVHDWDGTPKTYDANKAVTDFAKVPTSPSRHDILAGTYSIVHTSDRVITGTAPTGADCFTHIPKTTVTLEAGKTYHFFVLNQFGCRFDASLNERTSTSVLSSNLVEVAGYNLEPLGGASFTSAQTNVDSGLSLLSAASPAATCSLLLAAVLALLALVL